MGATFRTSDLIETFREGLVALIPVAERARIAWRGPTVYDPWERIEQALFASVVASVVENASQTRVAPLPKYGLTYSSYADRSYFTERAARLRGEQLVFLGLTTTQDPFDTMRFLDVDAAFVPTGRAVHVPLSRALPELATRAANGVHFCDVVEYDD